MRVGSEAAMSEAAMSGAAMSEAEQDAAVLAVLEEAGTGGATWHAINSRTGLGLHINAACKRLVASGAVQATEEGWAVRPVVRPRWGTGAETVTVTDAMRRALELHAEWHGVLDLLDRGITVIATCDADVSNRECEFACDSVMAVLRRANGRPMTESQVAQAAFSGKSGRRKWAGIVLPVLESQGRAERRGKGWVVG